MITNRNPLILYSGEKILQESGSKNININFLYLTKIDIPKLLLFIDRDKVYLTTKKRQETKIIKRMLGKKEYIFIEIYFLINSISFLATHSRSTYVPYAPPAGPTSSAPSSGSGSAKDFLFFSSLSTLPIENPNNSIAIHFS